MATPSPKGTARAGGKARTAGVDLLRDLDRDGDVDVNDDRANDLNRDGRIDANDSEIHDVDNDHDVDAADRELAAEPPSVGASLGWKKAEAGWTRPEAARVEQGAGVKRGVSG